MPAPAEPRDARGLQEGLARVQVNEQGTVMVVKIVQRTGRAQFDAEAVDTLRRWRAKPGVAREVEIPLTSVIAGKRIPFRVPTTAGSMTSG